MEKESLKRKCPKCERNAGLQNIYRIKRNYYEQL